MTARRNSPRVDQLGTAGAVRARSALNRAPPAPMQSEMRGMETSASVALLASVQRQEEGKRSKNKEAEDDFDLQCRSYRLPPYVRQFELLKFEQTPRKDGKAIPKVWRFDFVWPQFKLIVEVNGGVWMPGGGAHSHPIDITRNMTKQNEAVFAGFQVLQFTPDDIQRRQRVAISFTQRVLASKGWTR